MAKDIMRKLKRANKRVRMDVAALSKGGGLYGAGLASEGYLGGYQAALDDVQLALNGAPPCRRPKYWDDRTA